MKEVRTAIDYAERRFGIRRLLLSEELRTAAGGVFIEHLGDLVNLGKSGQLALIEMLQGYLSRIEWIGGLPSALFPVTSRGLDGPKIVTINPRVSFGRPIIFGNGVRTLTITERLDNNESREKIAADYGLTDAQIDEAILYEAAA